MTVAEPHTPDEVRSAERSFAEPEARADVVSRALPQPKPRSRLAWQAIGPTTAGVMLWVVLGNGSLNAFTAAHSIRKATASQWLRDGLARLTSHYAERDGQPCAK